MNKQHTSTIVGSAIGVVLLVVLAGFAIFLPRFDKGSDDAMSTAGGSGSLPALPQQVAGLVSLDSGKLPSALAQQIGDLSQVAKVQEQAGSGLSKLYGVPARYGFYASTDGSALVAVIVLDRQAGLFAPDGPPVSARSGQQATYQLAKVGGAVCAKYYSQQTSSTGQASGAPQLSRVHCQLGSGGRTYDADARGLSAARTAAVVTRLADA